MKITFGRSVQIIQMGQPESWNKAMAEDEVKENETEAEAWERLVKAIYGVHEKYSQSFVEPEISFTGATKKETFADLKKELNVTTK